MPPIAHGNGWRRLAQKILKTEELLAILLRVGVSGENAVQMGQRLLHDMKGLTGLQKASFVELAQQHGLGTAKAAQIKAAIELGRRLVREFPDQPVYLNNPQAAADMVKFEMAAFTQEHLWVLLADTRNRWISTEKIYKGSLNASTVRIGELFQPGNSAKCRFNLIGAQSSQRRSESLAGRYRSHPRRGTGGQAVRH